MKPLVLFDFDGVIIESFDILYQCSLQVVEDAAHTQEDYRDFFNGNIYESSIQQESEARHQKPLTQDPIYDCYIPEIMNLHPRAGMKECLHALSGKVETSIVTSSINRAVEGYLEAFELSGYFNKIYDAMVHRSKVAKIHMALEDHGKEPHETLFVTDTLGDLREAEQAGIHGIGVTWGFHDRERLRQGSPHAIVDSARELHTAIQSYFEL